LDFALSNRSLVSDVRLVDVFALGQSDLEHGNGSAEFKVIEASEEWLELVNNGDVGDLVDLVESCNSVLDEFSKIDS
jgi:hypothetical protein